MVENYSEKKMLCAYFVDFKPIDQKETFFTYEIVIK